MHRSDRFRSSGPSTPCSREKSNRRRPTGVIDGTRPFSGSMTREVRRSPTTLVPRSQCDRSLTRLSAVCASYAAASAAVRTAFSENSSGRSRGVIVRLSQIPRKSGSPHGVTKRLEAFAGACASAGATGATAPPIAISADITQIEGRRHRSDMVPLPTTPAPWSAGPPGQTDPHTP